MAKTATTRVRAAPSCEAALFARPGRSPAQPMDLLHRHSGGERGIAFALRLRGPTGRRRDG